MDNQPPNNTFVVIANVVEEKGQWAVYLQVNFCKPNSNEVVVVHHHYIRSFRTQRLAEIAAGWYKKAAERGPNINPDSV